MRVMGSPMRPSHLQHFIGFLAGQDIAATEDDWRRYLEGADPAIFPGRRGDQCR
jgi:hypothetical protein